MRSIVPIVEGQSEVESIPVLCRRLLAEMGVHDVDIARPFLVKRTQIVREADLRRAVKQAVRARDNVAGVLILVDADDDPPADLASALLARAGAETTLPLAVVIAERELEGWFLGAKTSLRGVRGISVNANIPASPEGIRGAKEHLTNNMDGGRRYVEVDDQPALMAEMDLQLAQANCASFRKFRKEFERLVHAIRAL